MTEQKLKHAQKWVLWYMGYKLRQDSDNEFTTTTELARAYGAGKGWATRRLSSLQDKGFVKQSYPRGPWCLTGPGIIRALRILRDEHNFQSPVPEGEALPLLEEASLNPRKIAREAANAEKRFNDLADLICVCLVKKSSYAEIVERLDLNGVDATRRIEKIRKALEGLL